MAIMMAKDQRDSQQLLAEAAVMTYVFYVNLEIRIGWGACNELLSVMETNNYIYSGSGHTDECNYTVT